MGLLWILNNKMYVKDLTDYLRHYKSSRNLERRVVVEVIIVVIVVMISNFYF